MASSLFIHSSKKRPWEDSYYCCRVGHSCSHDTDFTHEEDQAQARPAILKEHFLQLRESCSSINSPRRCQWTYLPFLPHGHLLFKRKNCNKVKLWKNLWDKPYIPSPEKPGVAESLMTVVVALQEGRHWGSQSPCFLGHMWSPLHFSRQHSSLLLYNLAKYWG